MKNNFFCTSMFALLFSISAVADERAAKAYADDRTSLFKVPLTCGPFEGFGCGSAARPLLSKLERELPESQAWLNQRGTILAVVWPTRDSQKPGESKVAAIARLGNLVVTSLEGEARADAARELVGGEPWYQTNELEKLSQLEASTFSTRFADRVAASMPLEAGVREKFQRSIYDVLVEHFRKTDGRPTLALKKQLMEVARKHLGQTGVAAFERAIKNGSKRQPGDSV